MQDSFARARTRPKGYAAARPSARATIGYLVYKRALLVTSQNSSVLNDLARSLVNAPVAHLLSPL